MYIYLTRHGETIWNIDKRTQGTRDIPLSSRGIRQSEALAERLADENISTIYTSILDRAYHTANIIGERIGLQPIQTKELNEVNFGSWEGLTLKEIEAKYPGRFERFFTDFNYAPDNGESIASLQSRIRRFIQLIKEKHADKEDRILIVSHAYPVRMLIIELMNFPAEHLFDFQLDNTGISIIRWDNRNGKNRLMCLNDICHLQKHDYVANPG
ncbi:MAG TPA: histidine phosphatase family protein [Clostridiales bacterium]|nr:histidine phosphatase family protein [Clostridiales bacterium]